MDATNAENIRAAREYGKALLAAHAAKNAVVEAIKAGAPNEDIAAAIATAQAASDAVAKTRPEHF